MQPIQSDFALQHNLKFEFWQEAAVAKIMGHHLIKDTLNNTYKMCVLSPPVI
jgi:hypothetical protein